MHDGLITSSVHRNGSLSCVKQGWSKVAQFSELMTSLVLFLQKRNRAGAVVAEVRLEAEGKSRHQPES